MMKIVRTCLILTFLFAISSAELLAQEPAVPADTTSAIQNKKSKSAAREARVAKADDGRQVEHVHTTDSALQKKHSPKIAIALSAVLPGAGQVYNRKAWKIPIVYTLIGGAVTLSCYFGVQMKAYTNEYIHRANGETALLDPDLSQYEDETLISLKKTYTRYMEISIAATGILYLLNIIDAAVDAHLYYFDITDDLTFHVSPYVQPSFRAAPAHAGVSFALKWK